MSFARLKETFFRLPRHIKLIGVGSLILAISTILPWYADLDTYKIGDEFLGITGPASFGGIIILLLSGFSFTIFAYHLLERRMRRLPVREGIIHLAVAIESALLLVIVNSIYFHPKFGVNITLKESRFGMTVAFVGTIVLFIGAYVLNREERTKETGMGKLEPLIQELPEPALRQQRPVAMPPPSPRFTGTTPRRDEETQRPRSFLFGERPAQSGASRTGTSAPSSEESHAPEKHSEGGGSYKIRMDL